MTINKNSVEQINVALLDMDKKIKNALSNGTSASDFKNLEASVDNIKRTLNETKTGLEPGKTYNINISGNAATADKATTATTAETATNANHAETATTADAATNANHALTADTATNVTTANKVANALTVNGKTYDGSSAVNAGVQTVANGGTGVTTQADINKAFISNLDVGNSDVTDGTEFVSSWASDNGFAETADGAVVNTPYKRQFIKVWNYIKDKISSVLGLTKDNYGGRASTAGTADYARNMYYQNLDLSALDKTKFYPLVCYTGNDFAEVAICSESGLGSMEYNQNRIHFDISTQGWSDLSPTLNIREYACYENNEITIGCIGRGYHNGAWAIWLRGGIHYTCFSRNSDLTLHTSDYTFGDETYTVGTNYYGGSNTNVSIWFTPQSTITEGAYSSRPITAPRIKADYRMVIPIGAPSSLEDGCIWIS